jgi:hypothetical protein
MPIQQIYQQKIKDIQKVNLTICNKPFHQYKEIDQKAILDNQQIFN